ncbi:MAG: hypothetical protein AAEJ52_09900 [Myxococcota bacterium]
MTDVLMCEGAPRDLGLDQGRWCRATLAASYCAHSTWERTRWRLGRHSEESWRVARDLRRYFPQQSEVIEGLSCGASVPGAWLVEMIARETRHPMAKGSLAFAASSQLTDGQALLSRTFPDDTIVRRCRPEGGFASIELIRPWSTAPLAGINEGGLAVVTVPQPGGSDLGGCAAPVTLLAHDCLSRFESIDAALDWCMARPGAGVATILLADTSGEIAGVQAQGAERRVFRPADGLFLHTGGHERESEIGKALRQASPLVAADLGRFLGLSLVALDSSGRRMGLLRASSANGRDRWLDVES